ncbi:amidohydrolase family protein [Pseudolysinimonas sp.]|uniref:amidohydrolase family protein n=1 Tax=Pseudolysinimonas sp. TaxID=2680009 RepID=UPI003F7D85DD
MPELPMPVSALRGAALADGSTVDVRLARGRVEAVVPAAGGTVGPDELDLTGYTLLTAAADPHAHLDKARSWDAIQPPMGDLGLAIASWKAHTISMTEDDIAERALAQALEMLANGTTAIRTHVDILTTGDALRGVRALVTVREHLAGLMDLELVALAGPEAPDAAVEAALDAGVDAVGGAPHLAADPVTDLRRLLAIAERRGTPVDLHTDESLDGADTLLEFARIVRDWPQNVSAGHCVRLGMMTDAELAPVVAEVVASRVGVIANPITNLYLQGWESPVGTPRGLTALRTLLDAGARVAAGADNVRDPFNPLGRGDALETAMLLVVAGHLTIDEAYGLVADGAREVMGLPAAGPVPGAAADLLAVRASGLAEVVASAPADRIVLHAGRIVARSELTRHVAAPASARSPLLEAAR